MSGTRRRFFQDAAMLGAGLFGLSKSLQAQEEKPKATATARGKPWARTAGGHFFAHGDAGRAGFCRTCLERRSESLPLNRRAGAAEKSRHSKPSMRGATTEASPGRRSKSNRAIACAWCLKNRLPESTTPHWHGLEVPIDQDGVAWISQKPVAPGEKYVYEFTVHQEGTFFYHAHSAMQEMMGQVGFFVAHPQKDYKPRVDHDYGVILQEWAVLPSNTVPNTAAMEFNWLTFTAFPAPMTTPLLARLGSRVRLRFVNLGMDHHPIHLHGHQFVMTGNRRRQGAGKHVVSDEHRAGGGGASASGRVRGEISGAQWMLHCHLPPSHDE